MTTIKTSNDNGDFGFTFVGNYLHQCARVEAWALTILSANLTSGKKSKVPHLFGQKLKAVSDLTASNAEIFSKPKRVIELMGRFAEPAKLRSNLAHALVSSATSDKGTVYLFHNPGTNERFWFEEDQMRQALTELKKLVKEVTDQKLKTPTPASSQLQPKRGAANGL